MFFHCFKLLPASKAHSKRNQVLSDSCLTVSYNFEDTFNFLEEFSKGL